MNPYQIPYPQLQTNYFYYWMPPTPDSVGATPVFVPSFYNSSAQQNSHFLLEK